MFDDREWSTQLERDGLLERDPAGELCTTRRWHGALARAGLRLFEAGVLHDMRTPIAAALVELYSNVSEEALTGAVYMMLVVTQRELTPPTVLAH
jgi:hypothetical protein